MFTSNDAIAQYFEDLPKSYFLDGLKMFYVVS